MRSADAEYYDAPTAGMASVLQGQLAKTPWWMISIAVHAVLVMILFFVMFEVAPASELQEVQMAVTQPEEDPFDEPIKEEEIESPKPIENDEPVIEDPIIKEAEESDHNESDDNEEFNQSKGEENNASDRPLQGKYWNASIGVGGGASGAYGNRFGGNKDLRARGSGGSTATQKAVAAGLQWLRNHQSRDGSWSCDNFQHNCTKNVCDGKGSSADHTPGTTSLALLAFLGAGHSIKHGQYKEIVKRGCKYLMSIQTPDGCIGAKTGDGHYMYNHAIGTMALAEAYGLSNLSPSLKGPAQKAVDFLMSAQNPYLGWRYGIRPGDNDTSLTGWAVLALKSAKLSELNVPPEGFAGAKNWIDKVTDDSFYKTGYTAKGDNGARLEEAQRFQPTEAMTAAGLASRIFMGARPDDPAVRGGATLLKNQPPKWNPETGNDFYYWYYGTLAMFQVGGDAWTVWNGAMKEALVKTQRRGGDEDGSWDATSAWGSAGGRVYSTAINILSLEIYYRYGKVLGSTGQKG